VKYFFACHLYLIVTSTVGITFIMDALLVAVGWELQEQHPKQEHPARQSI
jgi:hypothetical protein